MNELRRHDTPAAVATVLAKHVPRKARSILDPCVGSGVLVEPLVSRAISQKAKVICFDIDVQAVESTRHKFEPRLGTQLHVEQADFLSPRTAKLIRKRWSSIDCVLMNPPFAGQTSSWRSVSVSSQAQGNQRKKFAPFEGAFLFQAVSLLAENGRLLAVLPASIISGMRCRWIRLELALLGSILHVHELPRRTFPNVESRIYLLVFERGRTRSKIVLCNHELNEPHRMVIDRGRLASDWRLDYNHHKATEWFQDLRTATPNLQWRVLSAVANVTRGDAISNGQKTRAIHTTDKRNSFWHSKELYVSSSRVGRVTVGQKDILLARIGRGCRDTAGFATGPLPARFSDCVFGVHPKTMPQLTLLFAIRCLFGFPLMESVVERGTGAVYIAATDLKGIQIPLALAFWYPGIFDSYSDAVNVQDECAMRLLENRVRRHLLRCVPPLSSSTDQAHDSQAGGSIARCSRP